jgi:hypothetical protein
MKKLATLMIVFISLSLQGQVWIDQGATWHYDWSGTLPAFSKIEYIGDTVINNKSCQQLEVRSYMFSPIEVGAELLSENISYEYTYASGDTVFYLVNDEFYILYNFAAQPGDSWDLGVDTNNFSCGPSRVSVLSTGSTEINGQIQEWIQVTTEENSSVGLEGKIYKRFGAVDNYLFPTGRSCDQGIIIEFAMYKFTCFEDDSFTLYNTTFNDCDYLLYVGISENAPVGRQLVISPNPASNYCNLQIPEHFARQAGNQLLVEVFNAQGYLISQRTIAYGDGHLQMDISQLSAGFYIVQVSDQKSNMSHARLLVE